MLHYILIMNYRRYMNRKEESNTYKTPNFMLYNIKIDMFFLLHS